MIYISNDVKVRTGIVQGCVYNFSPTDGVLNHYYVVLNKNPKTDSQIYLVPFTTKRENILKFIEMQKISRKTLVDIPDKECSYLSRPQDTGIDCNRPKETEITTLIQLIDNSNGSCNYPKVGEKLMNEIIQGVKASPMVKPIIKDSL